MVSYVKLLHGNQHKVLSNEIHWKKSAMKMLTEKPVLGKVADKYINYTVASHGLWEPT